MLSQKPSAVAKKTSIKGTMHPIIIRIVWYSMIQAFRVFAVLFINIEIFTNQLYDVNHNSQLNAT